MKISLRSANKGITRLTILSILMFIVGGTASAGIDKYEQEGEKKPRTGDDVEIRFEYNPFGPFADLSEYYSVFMIINENGHSRALRYGLLHQIKNVAAYEGVFPETEVQRLFARVRGAFRLPKHRKGYHSYLVYEDNGFYLGVKSADGKVKEMSGGDGPRPDEVRALLAEMSELWKRLSEVTPEYAYVTSSQIEKDRLRRLKREAASRLTSVESLPASLQALLIPVVTQPRNFYPLTQTQYDQYQTYHRPLTYKGAGYELTVILAAKEIRTQKIKVNQYEDLTAIR